MELRFRAFRGASDWEWVNKQVGILRVEDTSGIMAIDAKTLETAGACILDNWTDNSVQTHFMISSPLVLRGGFLEECYSYVFNHCNKKYMYGMVPANNVKAIKFNEHMGWTVKMVLPEAYADGVDYLVMELKRENCKFLEYSEAA